MPYATESHPALEDNEESNKECCCQNVSLQAQSDSSFIKRSINAIGVGL
ncbi:hypothetical protein [Leptolyngbya ohadii]|nr:hypothetical protein [Leptolyngbya ohadii]